MTENHFSVEDDDILASVLEESLRHYNEVEVPLRAINVDSVPGSKNTANINMSSAIEVIDLCESPKKLSTVQSRLSKFFKKPKIDELCNNEIISDHDREIDKFGIEGTSSSVLDTIGVSSSPAIFYKEPDANGFHLSSGSHYVYPSNFPVREYQMEIIKTALFHNTLVSLPTGLGKTFIAAVVMYNFYRWYPIGKTIFMAPTRPLVAQQIEACHSIMGIPRDVTYEMTGNIPPEQRYLAWKKYRVFFLTPQVLANDLSFNKCPSDMLKCIIVDEAHRATKDYAYVQVLKRLHEENRVIRIIGLSATPGTTVDGVIEVIQNLNISKLEFRTEESPDVIKYINKKDVECISVKLTTDIMNIRNQFLVIYDKYSRRLKQYRALNGNVTNLTKFQILGAKQKFVASNMAREMPKPLVGCLINDFTVCMSLAYTLELLIIYGIKAFYLQSLELIENHKCLSNDADLQKIMHEINKKLNSQDLTWSHPKMFELKKIVQDYFGKENSESNSKIIIFCQYRLVVVEVFELLKTFGSSVKPVMFVGQSLKEKGGLPQKKQLEVMNRFKSGDFNVLIATSVAEEGLDIGEVDLIICLEANKSPIKFVQRLGRTGRKRSGKCITLLTEGKEQMKYKSSVSSSKTLVVKMLKNNTIRSKLAPGGPRLIPKHINPQCLMIHVKHPEECLPEKKKRNGKKKDENIMRFIEPNVIENEEGLDIFQNNKDKPKKKSKKRKTTAEETNHDGQEIKLPIKNNTDLNSEYKMVDDLNAPENNVVIENECNSREDEVNCFVDEEKAFNEWLESCQQSNSVVLNDLFFKLLNLFTDCSEVNNECDGNKLSKFDNNGVLNVEHAENIDLFRSKKYNEDYMRNNTNFNHDVSSRNAECLFLSKQQNSPSVVRDGNKISVDSCDTSPKRIIGYKRVNDKSMEEINSENMFLDQQLDKHTEIINEQLVVRQMNSDNSICPIDKSTSPIICSNRNAIVSNKLNVDRRTNKVDFSQFFQSQRDNENNDDGYLEKVVDQRDQSVQRKSKDNIGVINQVMNTIKTVNCSVNKNEYNMLTGSMDSDDIFKSNKSEVFIEENNDSVVAEQPNDDGSRSPVIYSNRYKMEIVNRNFNEHRRERKVVFNEIQPVNEFSKHCERKIMDVQRPKNDLLDTTIDLVDDDDDDEYVENFDFEDIFKSQRADRYIENYNENIGTTPDEKADDNKPTNDGDDNDDDVISISESPEFFNCKLPKKTVVEKLTDTIGVAINSVAEIVNLTLPSRDASNSRIVNDKVPVDVVSDRSSKAIATNSASDPNCDTFEDDDMDFMFVDYCSNNFVLTQQNPPPADDAFTQKQRTDDSSGVERSTRNRQVGETASDDVFTQKQKRVDDVSDTDVFTQRPRVGDETDVFTQRTRVGDETDVFTQRTRVDDETDVFTQRTRVGDGDRTAATGRSSSSAVVGSAKSAEPSTGHVDATKRPASLPRKAYANDLMQFNIMKACNLLKPGFSLKRNLAATRAGLGPPGTSLNHGGKPVANPQPSDHVSLINPPGRRWRPRFSQSTPKVSTAKKLQPETAVVENMNTLLTTSSSSEQDVFVNSGGGDGGGEDDNDRTIRRRRVRRKRRPKPKKKLVFIDDEADVSNCGEAAAVTRVGDSSSEEIHADDTDGDEFDSSFIDDDDSSNKSEPSTSMTKQYLRSVKSPPNVRGVFKIPKLSRQHFNIDVYSQMDDRNDNDYVEDSFCVRDTSDLNTSSNASPQQTSEERPSKPQKRKRILSPRSSDSDSPDHFNTLRKRKKFKTSLDFS